MIQYILECIAFQLVFLIIYDFLLKRETFFQWNRSYLIGTYILSLVLPWIKIEALKAMVPERFYAYPEFLWGENDMIVTVASNSPATISMEYVVLFIGILLASLLFGYKMLQLYRLRKKGQVRHFTDYTRILVANSNLAFSFFKSIFLGDEIVEDVRENIIRHEMVHIRQRHSFDLLFFELLRIVCWFNPLVYVYQSRIAELHEFIADTQVAKTDKKEHYQLLLSQVFQTQHISFVNQFFKSSLIKKRIVMLQKSRSKKVWQLKYLLLIPLVLAMLLYSSCERESKDSVADGQISLTEKISALRKEIEEKESLTQAEKEALATMIYNVYPEEVEGISGEKGMVNYTPNKNFANAQAKYNQLLTERNRLIRSTNEKNPIIVNLDQQLTTIKQGILGNNNGTVPFGWTDQAPIFPGCEGATDKHGCFQESMQNHIKKHFKYPQEAQEKGIQGKVNIMFIISDDGSITNIRKRGPDKLLENEAERIVRKLPQMKPGKYDGKSVNVPFSIPISFRLQ